MYMPVKLNVRILLLLISMTAVLIIGLLLSQRIISQRQIRTVFLDDKYNFNEQLSGLLLQKMKTGGDDTATVFASVKKTIDDVFNKRVMLFIAVMDKDDRLIT